MKKFYILSDEHGNLKAVQEGLKKAGYDENNKDHFLISAGDCFDRGDESLELYQYYKRLCDENKMIVCYGNHNEFLIDFLKCQNIHKCHFNYVNNGLRYTIDSFLGQTCAWDTFVLFRANEEEQREMTSEDWWNMWTAFVHYASEEINKNYPELLGWLESMPYYVELKHSIISHGMIDCEHGNWRTPLIGWKKCIWASPEQSARMYNNTGKHIYVGHIHSDLIREFFYEEPTENTVFTRPQGDVTYLDACTVLTNKVNVVCIEDDFEEEE